MAMRRTAALRLCAALRACAVALSPRDMMRAEEAFAAYMYAHLNGVIEEACEWRTRAAESLALWRGTVRPVRFVFTAWRSALHPRPPCWFLPCTGADRVERARLARVRVVAACLYALPREVAVRIALLSCWNGLSPRDMRHAGLTPDEDASSSSSSSFEAMTIHYCNAAATSRQPPA